MKRNRQIDKKDVVRICDIATDLFNLEKGSLSCRSRIQEFQLPRMAVSNIARIEKGIHYNTIAEVLKRDRSSIYHYEGQHKVLYETWSVYREIFNKIFNKYSNSKKSNLTLKSLRVLLKKAGVKNINNPTVFITVQVVNKKIVINSDYMSFNNTVELIKFALKDYLHHIKIDI